MIASKNSLQSGRKNHRTRNFVAAFAVAIATLLVVAPSRAQTTTAGADKDDVIDEIQVTGNRQIIQSTINIKRNSTTIVDGLSAADIGDLPALSIGYD